MQLGHGLLGYTRRNRSQEQKQDYSRSTNQISDNRHETVSRQTAHLRARYGLQPQAATVHGLGGYRVGCVETGPARSGRGDSCCTMTTFWLHFRHCFNLIDVGSRPERQGAGAPHLVPHDQQPKGLLVADGILVHPFVSPSDRGLGGAPCPAASGRTSAAPAGRRPHVQTLTHGPPP